MLKEIRRGERARGDAAAVFRVLGSDIGCSRRQFGGPGFTDDLMLSQGEQVGNADPRIVLDGQPFSIRQRQARVLTGSGVIRRRRRCLAQALGHRHCALPSNFHKRRRRSIRQPRLGCCVLSG